MIVTLGLALAAPVADAQDPKPLQAGTAIIRGQVVEAGTTSGIADVIVTLSGSALGSPTTTFTAGASGTSGMPGGPRRVATDADGRFFFREIPAGAYTLATAASGYVSGAYGETRTIQIRRSLDLVRTIEIVDGEKPDPITIQMWKLGGIGGMVIDEANEPVIGASVTILARMTDWGGPVMQPALTVTTDDRGMYHADVTPGDYLVAILAATTTVPAAAADEFLGALAEGGAAQQRFMSEMSASGGVLARGVGVRVGDLLVNQWGAANLPAVPPIVSSDGAVTFYPTTFHPSSTSATTATLIRIGSGEEKAGVDVHLRPVAARRVTGRVIGPAGAVRNLGLRLVANDPAARRTSPATIIDAPQALSAADGSFTFISVAPGAYVLTAVRTGLADDSTLWAAQDVSVGEADVEDLQLILQTGAQISGRVVIEGDTRSLPAAALRTLAIVPSAVPASHAALQANIGPSRPDEALQFTTASVIPGPYMMTVTGIPSGWVLKSVMAGPVNLADQPFDLAPSGQDGVVVTITDRISTLGGIVRDAESRPMPSATVAVFPTDKSLWRLPGMASRRVQTAAPGREGRFSFRGLPAGEYFVVAADWPAADFSDGNVLSKLIPSASRVSIPEGASRTQDLRAVVIR